MGDGVRFTLVEARAAAAVAAALPLGEAAGELLGPGLTPEGYFARLRAAGLGEDAARFLSGTLPRPAAVWWACLCVRDVGAAGGGPAAAAVAAAEAWVRN